MRRPTRLTVGVLAAAALVLTPAMAGTSAAAPSKGGGASQSGGKASGKPAAKPASGPSAKPGKPGKPAKPSKAKSKVVVVGVVAATPTTVTGAGTSTVVIKVKVFGGDSEYKGKTVTVKVPKDAVVKRNHGKKTRYELKNGDKVTVHARRDAAGNLTAYYVAASGRSAQPVQSPPPATSTARTSG